MNAEFIAEIAARTIEKQTPYRKYANTVNSFVGSLVAVLVFLAGYWATTGQFPEVQAFLAFIVPFGAALSTRLTKNAVTPASRQALIDEALNQQAQKNHGLPVYSGPTSAVE